MKQHFALAILAILAVCATVTQPPVAAKESFEKPLFLMVFDKTCHAWCEKVRPMVKELREQYQDQIDFGELDTTQEALKKSKQDAIELGVIKLLPDFGERVPLCAVCGKDRKNALKEVSGPKTKDVYEKLIQYVLSKN